jgi:pantothenate kinase-related protein Tda10
MTLGAFREQVGMDDNETSIHDLIADLLDLDDSYLLIQGPFGTGKTYTAAEIVALLPKKGYRVGVTSNSHKAINTGIDD